MTDDQLAEIEARVVAACGCCGHDSEIVTEIVPALVAEVRRLRALVGEES